MSLYHLNSTNYNKNHGIRFPEGNLAEAALEFKSLFEFFAYEDTYYDTNSTRFM